MYHLEVTFSEPFRRQKLLSCELALVHGLYFVSLHSF